MQRDSGAQRFGCDLHEVFFTITINFPIQFAGQWSDLLAGDRLPQLILVNVLEHFGKPKGVEQIGEDGVVRLVHTVQLPTELQGVKWLWLRLC